ncbi:hypothetical protein FRC04_004956 [Tulasnella sp. 424]|nr:hypothetical protein FRC04_004956 [Tulasnella sp. 424]
MDTPAAAPSQPPGGIQSAWVTFGGSPGESSGEFIQAIQRVAFQQGHTRDDRWIADYISTCFNGNALHWYSRLDGETQESWRELRIALLERFPATSPSPVPTTSTGPPRTSAPGNSRSPGARNTTVNSGCIEIVGDRTTSLGYLYLDSNIGVGITTNKAGALKVNLPAQPLSEPIQLSLLNLPSNGNANFPNLGLALLKGANAQPDQIPAEIKIVKEWVDDDLYDEEGGYELELGIPNPSVMCKGRKGVSRGRGIAIATWTLSLCGDSRPGTLYRRRATTAIPSQRAAAAIWNFERSTNELRIKWLMDDDTECELGGYVQQNSPTNSLHVHRIKDMQEAGRFFEEDRVRFVFQPTQ